MVSRPSPINTDSGDAWITPINLAPYLIQSASIAYQFKTLRAGAPPGTGDLSHVPDRGGTWVHVTGIAMKIGDYRSCGGARGSAAASPQLMRLPDNVSRR